MKLTEKINNILEFKVPTDLAGKLKHVKKKGNILTFKKEDVEFNGSPRKQIIVDKFKKSAKGVYIEGQKLPMIGGAMKTKVFKSEEELVDAVDWKWISKNAMD